jgi:ribosomal protein L29
MTLPQIKDSRRLSDEELAKEIISAKKQLFKLRIAMATSDFKQTHLIAHTKHRIGQLLTVERERQIAVAKIQGRKIQRRKVSLETQLPDSKVDVNILYAFDLINRGLEPEVRVVKKREGVPLINMIVQLYVPSWEGEDIPDYHEDFRFGNIIGFLGSLDTVNNLKRYAEVKFIEASKPAGVAESHSFELIVDEEKKSKKIQSPSLLINAHKIHEKKEEGDRVIIAVIDDGIDIFHEAFYTIDPITRNPKTRVLAVWDLTDINNSTDNPSNIVSPGVCSVGKEYTQEDIQANLDLRMTHPNTRPEGLTNGERGHGTMVTSIAAGNQGEYFPGGIAPQAKIVLIKIDYESFLSSHSRAVKYIQYISQREELPVVINVSQGINSGAHDGISTLENVYENFLNDEKFRFECSVVKSAGNERANKLHARINVQNKDTLTWDSEIKTRSEDRIQLWFSSINKFKFCLEYRNSRESTEWVDLETNSKTKFTFSSGNECKIEYWKHKNDERNVDSCLEIIIGKGNSILGSIMTGFWDLKIKRIKGTRTEGFIDAWIEIGIKAIKFNNHAQEKITLTIPGTAKHIITVGSAVLEDGSFDAATTSSFGPTRDTRDGRTKKPCIAAPGENICAAYSGLNQNDIGYAQGTSVAAPQITGAIALVLSARSKLSPSQKLTAAEIQDEIRQATIESGEWNEGLGYGVLDTEKLFNALVKVN